MEVTYFDRKIETAGHDDLIAHQTSRLQMLLKELLASNSFYGRKLRESGFTDARMLRSLDDVKRLPFTCKDELVEDQNGHPPFGTNLTYPLDRYIHLHQTSGTMGKAPTLA